MSLVWFQSCHSPGCSEENDERYYKNWLLRIILWFRQHAKDGDIQDEVFKVTLRQTTRIFYLSTLYDYDITLCDITIYMHLMLIPYQPTYNDNIIPITRHTMTACSFYRYYMKLFLHGQMHHDFTRDGILTTKWSHMFPFSTNLETSRYDKELSLRYEMDI